METSLPPHPAIELTSQMYHQLVYTLMGLLPPPLDASLEALRARNAAAIAKIAALMPVGASEIDLAAHYIAARAQAEEMLRLVRENADDVRLVMQLNAQYASMVRTSLAVHGQLIRVQAVRQKREAIEGAATRDAQALHIVEQSMLAIAEPHAARVAAARTEAASAAGVEENVSENGTDSHDVAFETRMSAQPRSLGARGPDETGVDAAMAGLVLARVRLAGQALSANGPDSLGRAA